MANEALAVRSTLVGIRTQLTTAVPLAIAAITADGGLTLTAPTGYDVTDEIRFELQPPRVKIFAEGTWDVEHYMTRQENIVIPLAVATVMHVSDDPETNYLHALEMCRAIENALAKTWQSVTGAFWYRLTQGGVFRDATPNTSAHRRIAMHRGIMKVRTSRAE